MINVKEFNKNIREIPNEELIDCYRGNLIALHNSEYNPDKWIDDCKVVGLIRAEILRRMENSK